jgi:hypothetical protein
MKIRILLLAVFLTMTLINCGAYDASLSVETQSGSQECHNPSVEVYAPTSSDFLFFNVNLKVDQGCFELLKKLDAKPQKVSSERYLFGLSREQLEVTAEKNVVKANGKDKDGNTVELRLSVTFKDASDPDFKGLVEALNTPVKVEANTQVTSEKDINSQEQHRRSMRRRHH